MKSLDSKVKLDVLKGISKKMRSFGGTKEPNFKITAQTERKINPDYKSKPKNSLTSKLY